LQNPLGKDNPFILQKYLAGQEKQFVDPTRSTDVRINMFIAIEKLIDGFNIFPFVSISEQGWG
jgi:hypothetical protein